MRKQRVEIPYPLARGTYRDTKGRYCVIGWPSRSGFGGGGPAWDTSPLGKAFGIASTSLNDAPGEGLTMNERAQTLYGALCFAGYDPVVVDTKTGLELQ